MTSMDHKKAIHHSYYLIMEVTSYNQMAIMIAKLTKTKKSTFDLNYIFSLNTIFTML
jgi:hypothetical protein